MNRLISQWTVLIAATLSLGLMAQAQQNPSTSSSPSASSAPAAAAPTDPQIAHIAVTANQIDIDAGKMAQSKAKDKKVKDFAKQMVKDHSSANKQATDLAKKLKLTPEDNSTSQSLKKAAQDNMNHLKGLKGADFDKAYITQEVSFHQQVLESLDKILIPNAKNTELKDLLQKTRSVVQGHLEHAQNIQSSMSK